MKNRSLIALLAGLLGTFATLAAETALDRYVHTPDPAYEYHTERVIDQDGAKVHILEMTSQKWLTTNEVDRPIWKHWLIIVQPPEVASAKSLLFISGGGNDGKPREKADGNMVKMAIASKSLVAELKMVPNQPLYFKDESRERHEDATIAYTWDKYLKTGDEKWPLRLPMTKSAVRAMDTVQDYCAKLADKPVKVDGFVVAGGSKRGWTTWTTAAVDKRVIGIVPIVIDMLNILPSFVHHYEAYGFWAPAVGDYVAENIMDRFWTPEYKRLMAIEEPFEYRDRLTMPKYILNACGDQFFLPDSSQFYFNELKGQKALRYIPNTDHSMKESDAYESLLAAYANMIQGKQPPTLDWKLDGKGGYKVSATARPKAVKLWQAHNDNARDFRLETIGKVWTSTDLPVDAGQSWNGAVAVPEKGWTAFMIEATFDGPIPYKTTTEVKVIPEVLPFKGKTPHADKLPQS